MGTQEQDVRRVDETLQALPASSQSPDLCHGLSDFLFLWGNRSHWIWGSSKDCVLTDYLLKDLASTSATSALKFTKILHCFCILVYRRETEVSSWQRPSSMHGAVLRAAGALCVCFILLKADQDCFVLFSSVNMNIWNHENHAWLTRRLTAQRCNHGTVVEEAPSDSQAGIPSCRDSPGLRLPSSRGDEHINYKGCEKSLNAVWVKGLVDSLTLVSITQKSPSADPLILGKKAFALSSNI